MSVLVLLVMGYMEKVLAYDSQISSDEAKSVIQKRVEETIRVLKKKDFKHLSRLVHPDKGLRLSGSFLYKEGVVLKRHEIPKLMGDKKKFIPVAIGETGDSENWPFDDYFVRYVYDRDYSNAPEIDFNRRINRGSEGNNLFEFFPGAIIVEYHFPELDPQKNGRDWRSLYLVYEKADDSKWYLVDIAHAEKTE